MFLTEMECGSWSHKECFLFIIFESDSIRVSGLYSGWGPRSFSYDIQSDKGRMSMNSLWVITISNFLKSYIGDSEMCSLSSALKVNSSLTVLNLGLI